MHIKLDQRQHKEVLNNLEAVVPLMTVKLKEFIEIMLITQFFSKEKGTA